MQGKVLDVLFHQTLNDIYYAEKKILGALPKMAHGAQSSELRGAFRQHLEETQIHIERLVQVFDAIGKPARGKTCPAIDGIIEEGEEVLQAFADSPEAILIAAAQAVEHCEIARHGTLLRWAQVIGNKDAPDLNKQTFQEVALTDETLTLDCRRVGQSGRAPSSLNSQCPRVRALPRGTGAVPRSSPVEAPIFSNL